MSLITSTDGAYLDVPIVLYDEHLSRDLVQRVRDYLSSRRNQRATTGDNQPSLGHSRPPDRNEQSAISEVQRESDIPASEQPTGCPHECALCYNNIVDLAVGCGHTFCYDCFSQYFHEFVLAQTHGQELVARFYLRNNQLLPPCPLCRTELPGFYCEPQDEMPRTLCFRLQCPNSDDSDCFCENYFVQGIRLRIA